METEVEKAKAFLKQQGFQTENLWHIDDVKSKFKCTDEQAHDILIKALTNEATMEQVWIAIDVEGEERDLLGLIDEG
jgi:muramoyltetrapeptide carboxypeptidase LdcA involved in peptidoglycan recycling